MLKRTVDYFLTTLIALGFCYLVIAPIVWHVKQSIINSAACVTHPERDCEQLR
jgi:hypothetical protein